MNHDLVCHLARQVEDGVLVGLDRLGGVDDEHQWRIENLVPGAGVETISRS